MDVQEGGFAEGTRHAGVAVKPSKRGGFNRAAPRPPTRKNREPSPGKIGGPPPGKYENPDFRIFEHFLDF